MHDDTRMVLEAIVLFYNNTSTVAVMRAERGLNSSLYNPEDCLLQAYWAMPENCQFAKLILEYIQLGGRPDRSEKALEIAYAA